MGNSNNKKELGQNQDQEHEKKENKYINYYCKICKELPLLNFSYFYFDLICSNHKILNIPIGKFFNYIIFNYECSICKVSSNKSNNYYYFNNDNKIYCKNCIIKYKSEINDIQNIINVFQKNAVCLLHKKRYTKYCLNCKLNMCELCDNHNNHYIEIFKDIYPLKKEIDQFNLKNEEKYEGGIYFYNNYKYNKIKEVIEIKALLVKFYNEYLTNYYYINNINNIMRKSSINYEIYAEIKDIQYINIDKKNDINSIINKIPIKTKSHFFSEFDQIWCIKQLNTIKISPQQNLELIAIGFHSVIILLNVITFSVYQRIKEHTDKLYSFDQFENNPNYLFTSSRDEYINIFKLDSNYKYKLIQKIKKSNDKSGGEIGKVIILSNKLLVSGDHRSITIWKSDNKSNEELKYKDFYEILLNYETCNLLEVDPSKFIAAQYGNGGHFQVYKNDGETFPLIGDLNLDSHGYSTNSLCKINDKLICSLTEDTYFFIICIDPLQVIQKFFTKNIFPYYIKATKDNYLYYTGKNSIVQNKIIKDEDNNFIELVEIDEHFEKDLYEKSILPFDDGRIFFINKREYNLLT